MSNTDMYELYCRGGYDRTISPPGRHLLIHLVPKDQSYEDRLTYMFQSVGDKYRFEEVHNSLAPRKWDFYEKLCDVPAKDVHGFVPTGLYGTYMLILHRKLVGEKFTPDAEAQRVFDRLEEADKKGLLEACT